MDPGVPDQSIASLSQKQVDGLLQGNEVSVKGEDMILQFSDCKFLPKLQQNLDAAGYDTSTPVQMQAIPAALRGRDVLVSSETGSGKTASFLLPVIHCASDFADVFNTHWLKSGRLYSVFYCFICNLLFITS